jgi:hypothetical protein
MNRALVRRLWTVALLLATQAYAQTAGPAFPNPGKTSMSKDNQHALGMEVARQVYQQMPVLPDNSPESIFVAPQADFDRLHPTFEAMIKSVQFR